MARAGAKESLEQPPPEPRATARSGRTTAAKAKAAAKATAEVKPAKKAAAPAAKAGRAAKATSQRAASDKAASRSKTKETKAAVPAEKAPAPARGKKAAATGSPAKGATKGTVAPTETGPSGAGFPAKTMERLNRLLEEERETYLRQAHDLAAEAEALASEREPGDTQFDEESGEGDTLNVERERDLALSASARQAVEEIDRALRRVSEGTYGVCERCGKKISVARLEALPYAALCIDCKSREERRR